MKFLAFDLGATSGRAIIGTVENDKLASEEVYRFPNAVKEIDGKYYWDINSLFDHFKAALKKVAGMGVKIESIGIDTWGVDFGHIGKDGGIIGMPRAYRDPYTDGIPEEVFEIIPREELYSVTGVQIMNFNTIFQLYAMRKAGNTAMASADKILFVPDALSYMLTGNAVCEYTIASTGELVDPRTGNLDESLLATVGLTRSHFGKMVQPGTLIGTLTPEVQEMTGLGDVPVYAVAGHDTGSAVAAVPARDEEFAYLSSGTWSLMGIETREAVINERSYELNFTNEGGIEGTTRFLKNICGMWLLERCRKEWGDSVPQDYATLFADAMRVTPFQSMIDPDAQCFANPADMQEAIRAYCQRTGQHVPEGYAEIIRCIFDSLAMRYRQVFLWLKEFAGHDIKTLHIIGGGSKNDYLNQFTANATGVRVLAGPQEGTALGNIMVQAKAVGEVGDIWAMRRIIANSIQLKEYTPQDSELWAEQYKRYLEITES